MKAYTGSKRIFLFWLAFLVTVTATAAVHQPAIQVPGVSAIPLADGRLNDKAWQQSAALSEFVNWSLDRYIRDDVVVYLCHDENNIYVAFRNSDPDSQELNKTVSPKGPHDTFLWGRNHVSVSIEYTGVSVRMMADPKGTMTDWKNEDISWNGNWEYGVSINETDWTSEFKIPLKDLGITEPAEGLSLGLSLSRSYPHGESSGWSGTCRLTSEGGLIAEYGRWPSPLPGDNKLAFSARNNGNKKGKLVLELELQPLMEKPEFINQSGQGASSDLKLKINNPPLVYRYEYELDAGGSTNTQAVYNLPAEGSYFANVSVRSENGDLLRRSVDFWFTIDAVRKKLKEIKSLAGESSAALARIGGPVAAHYRDEAGVLLTSISGLENDADSYWNSGRWKEYSGKADALETETARQLHKVRWASLNNWKEEGDFGLTLTHSAIKLRKDAPFPLPLKDRIEISLAGNEYESFQLAILPFGKELKGVKAEISDLTGQYGHTLSKSNIEISLEGYNNIDWQADYVAERQGWHPDPLLPVPGDLNIGTDDLCRPFWITIYAPPGTPPGEYRGTVSISAAGMKPAKAEIICRVWNFTLPVESHLKTHSWDQLSYYRDFYNLSELPVDWYLRFCDLLLKNRFNPGSAGINYVSEQPDKKGKYDFSTVEKVLSHCIDRGLSRFSIIQMKKGLYKPEEAEKAYKYVEAYTKFLKEKGWLDKALVELWDEPTDLEWPFIKERAERLRKIDPGLRLQLFAEGGPYDFWDRETDKYGLNNLVNIWAPVNIIESPEAQAKGVEIWTYFCTLARESAPNFYIDCPAINQRSIAWYCWMYGVDGFEHWSTNYFWRNVRKGMPMDQKWPAVPWDSRTYYYFNGEGQLVYPGPDGMPVSSIRLENFREGMEDYEYLFRLKELLARFSDNTTDPVLNEYRQLLSPEEYLLYKYPRKIKVTLENTLRHPDRPELILETKTRIAMAIEDLQNR